MALGNYLSGLNLDPLSQERLLSMAAPPPPPPAPPLVPGAEFLPPTPGEMSQYGATTAQIAAAQRVATPGGMDVAKTAPLAADPTWTPEREAKATAMEQRKKELAAVTLEAPPEAEKGLVGGPEPIISPPMSGVFVPGRFEPGSRSVTTAKGLSREAFEPVLAGQDAAQGHGLVAADREMEAAQIKGAADASYAEAFSKASAEAARENQRLASERREYVMREQEKLDALSQKAQAKVDPDLAKGPIGAQVLGAIGVALGAFGSSMTGGQNAALTIVQNNIDRNIRAQEANIANANKTLSNEQSLYRQNLDAFGDRERAVLATKMQMLEQAKGLADKQYAMAGTKTSEAAVEKFKGALSNEAAQARARIIEITEDKAQTHETENWARAHMAGGVGGMSMKDRLTAAYGETGKEGLVVPELGVVARSEPEAIKLREGVHLTQSLVSELNKADALLEEAEKTNDPFKLRVIQRKLTGIAERASTTATVKAGQGAQSAGDRAVSQAGLGLAGTDVFMAKVPGTMSISDERGVIRAALEAHKQDMGRKGTGLPLAKETAVRNPQTGKVEMRTQLTGGTSSQRDAVDSLSDKVKAPVGKSSR